MRMRMLSSLEIEPPPLLDMDVRTDAEARTGTRDTRLRVLVVGTDRVACMLVMRLLERLGYPSPERCPTLSEAALQQHRFDLVLVDDSAIARGQSPVAARGANDETKVVFMGADSAACGIRVDARLRKPLSLEALRSTLAGLWQAQVDEDFDGARWRELLALFGRSGLAEMIAAIERDLPLQRLSLERALQDADTAALRRIAHTLCGVALQLGAEAFAALCTQVERRAAEGLGAEAATLGTQMLSRYVAWVARLQHELQQS